MNPLPISPTGLSSHPNFITPSHETFLLTLFRSPHDLPWPQSTKPGRISLHYGYHFDYKTFGIDPSIPYVPFPDWLLPLIPTGEKRPPEQVCLQYYPPGAGIPPHVDTHSAYDQLYSLSLGAPVMMQFKKGKLGDGQVVNVDLEPRMMLKMEGDSRLHWTHGIKKRKTDVLPDGTIRLREDRWSITYRWLRKGAACECGDVELCDTAQQRAGIEREYRWKQADETTLNKDTEVESTLEAAEVLQRPPPPPTSNMPFVVSTPS